jgi:hypothetical protein
MKRLRVMFLALIFVLALFTLSRAQPESVVVQIIPSKPTSADEVMVRVELKLCDCKIKFLEELGVYPERNLFEAKVFVEPYFTADIYPPPPCRIVEASHTYYLGRLRPGYYHFRLLRCQDPLGSICLTMWREEFEVTGTIEEMIDINGNDRIDDNEILFAVELWIEGVPIPGTSLVIDDTAILRLIDLWITGAEISCQ